MSETLCSEESRGSLAKKYERVRLAFFFFETLLSLAVVAVFSLAGPARQLSESLAPWVGSGYIADVVFTSLCLLGYSLFFLPLSYAGGYRLEHRFGLSNQTIATWWKDKAKSFAIQWVVLNIFALALFYLLRAAGDWWWFWAGCFWLVFGILFSHLFPVLVLPLFYKIQPLADQGLRDRLLNLAAKVKAKIVGVYQFDMSRRTKKANALFTGLGRTKRIILGDTLLEKFGHDEIEVILAHEMGHYVHRHIAKQIAASTAGTFLGLWLVHRVLSAFAGTWGYETLAQIAVLPVIGFLLSVLALIAMPLSNAYSRYCERQADRFALAQTGNADAFERGMEKLAEQNLANREPHPAVEFFLYSHPSISRRVQVARQFARQSTA